MMISINLVPIDQRRRKKKSLGGLRIPPEIIIGSGGGLILLLVCVHIILMGVNLTKLAQHKSLAKEWEEMQPAKKNVDTVINEMKELREQQKTISGLVDQNTTSWSEKLNIISDNLPKGTWIKKVNLTKNMLLIEGSAISRQNQQMINVHQFTSNLKKNERFLEGFEELELGSIQRRTLGAVEVANFLIKVRLAEDGE